MFSYILLTLFAVFSVCAGVFLFQFASYFLFRRWCYRVKLPTLTAFVGKDSFAHGEPIEVCVHSTQPVVVSLLRLGARLERINWTERVEPCRQSDRYDCWRGMQWPANLSIDTSELAAGMYVLHLEQQGNSSATYRVPFLIRSSDTVDVAVVASTNTWQAYNEFGGLSNYDDHVTPRPLRWLKQLFILLNWQVTIGDRHHFPAVPLPWNRPNDIANEDLKDLEASPIDQPSHLVRAEWSLLRYFENRGIRYGVFSDFDFAVDPLITQAKLLVFNTHSEYWSPEMIGRLAAYLKSGGQAMFVSGNNLYRKVQFLDHGLKVYDFKVAKQEVANLLGTAYDAQGYMTYAGYRVAAASHWLFDELDVQPGTLFAGSATDSSDSLGASGYETDKLCESSGQVELLAIGQNRTGPAYMVLKQIGQGQVLNLGSVASAPWVERDPVLAGIVDRFVQQAIVTPSSYQQQEAA